MPRDNLTFALDGDVTLESLAAALSDLRKLIDALGEQLASQPESLKWVVENLQPGSAVLTFEGQSPIAEDVDKVVDAYYRVGADLQSKGPSQFPAKVIRPARNLTKMLNGDITSIRFETPDDDIIIYERVSKRQAAASPPRNRKTFGAVSGRIQTITSRQSLRFTLYDFLHDKAVSCYLTEGQEDLLRDMWGHPAIVEGTLNRDLRTGRVVTIREIRTITRLDEAVQGGFRAARGVWPSEDGDLSSEEAIRRVRDGV